MDTPKHQNNFSSTTQIIARADVAIIGGGVVGCAVARKLTLEGASIVLIEKGTDILSGASKGNSAILHTGFDAPIGSLEWECVQNGYNEYLQINKSLNLPLQKTGALIAAWSEEQEAKFSDILKKGKDNNVHDLQLLSRKEILELEPNLGKNIRSAIVVPREFIIDPWSTPLAYLQQALENGGKALFNAEVTDGEFDGMSWLLNTQRGHVKATHVINCAGLYGDIVNSKVLGNCDFTIKPRKGQFVLFDKAARKLLSSVILPVPTARTKGIVLFPTIFGNVAVGPTAEDQDGRDDASVDKENLQALHNQALEKIPALANIPITATFAGIRPATEKSEYQVSQDPDRNWITLGGIRSTGLTSSLGLAQHVHQLLLQRGTEFKPLVSPIVPSVPNLAENQPRDYETSGYGEIVCHCEMVTDREINAAMKGSMPAGSIAGLKRRTRATMGRCQGFYCSARLAELTKGKFEDSIDVGKADV
ncbi:glycerol-3-phosphate dehydrogenase [Desulfuromusa kysingii]|uniref:Glycerol-3-phosphate dehydrogenase n=1 Tax=Desulfuromusa kysingii TaxID=37625 RepID=A0A1H3ZZD3_9BACT|nr:NAD(P)/FAD-dependent oxidoreductase [Desulfuromusa kysingii]SEA28997.1 glycerol-3-phosphate dehydrogenase [Desulfuromusa kysingii]